MESNTKHMMAVFSLMLGLSWGVPYMVSEERNTDWLMLAVFFLVLALIFWMWIMREQRSAEEEAEEALNAAEESIKKLEDQAKAQSGPESAVEVEAEPEPAVEPEPEPVAEVEAEPEPAVAVEVELEPEPEPEPVASGEPDELTRIEGIGPKYAEILISAGVTSYAQIAEMNEAEIVELIKANGGRKSASMATWAEQAKLAASGDWDGLEKLQDELSGGRR